MRVLLFLLLMALPQAAAADERRAARLNQEGNRLYQEGKMEEALARYAEGLEADPDSPALRYNMGNVLFRLQRLDEAAEEYAAAGSLLEAGRNLARDANYNHGNTLLSAGDYEGAIQRYRQVLLQSSGDQDARRNLEVALANLQEQQDEEKQQNKEGSGEPGEEEEKEQQQAEGEQQEDQGEPEPQEGEGGQEPPPQSEGPQEPAGPSSDQEQTEQPESVEEEDLDQEEARRLLEALSQDERADLKEMMERFPKKKTRVKRDW